MANYSVTVPFPKGDSLKTKNGSVLYDVQMVVSDGWATFMADVDTPEEFEETLINSIEGMPLDIKAVEAW